MVQDLGVYKLKIGPSYELKTGPSFFFHSFHPIFIVFFGYVKNTNSVNLYQKRFSQNCLDVKNEAFEKKFDFFILFFVGERERTKKETKWKKQKHDINIVFKVVLQKGEK